MTIDLDNIAGMSINSLGFETQEIGSIYVTPNSPVHYIDESNCDYLFLKIDNKINLIFKVDHIALHSYFKNKISFLELTSNSINGTIYLTSDSKTIISSADQLPKSFISILSFFHNELKLTRYGLELIRLNEVCASFKF